MLNKISETQMHRFRWGLALGWWLLIISMFYDPLSAYLTDPVNVHSRFHLKASQCALFQGNCLPVVPYPMGPRIFWGLIIPLVVITLVTLGHEAWRRSCPLAFMSQIPRALGRQRRRKVLNPDGVSHRYELVLISPDSWLGRNYLLCQYGLLFCGLSLRLLLVNSDRRMLGIFLIFTIASAVTVGFLFGGKSWCQYFCPMAPVQEIYTGPRGLLDSEATVAAHQGITQSMCRTVEPGGGEKSSCVSCQSPCFDIDAERAYWERLNHPDRRLVYYSYLGLVIGFYLYFFLYSGNWNFLGGSVWLETNQLSRLWEPGFYLWGQAIPIPKVLAVPLTLGVFSGAFYALGLVVEGFYQRHGKSLSQTQVRHRLFTLFTFTAFNYLYFLGVRPTLGWLQPLRPLVDWGLLIAITIWCYRSLGRTPDQYLRESLAHSLRRQIAKLALDVGKFLEGKTLSELKVDELYILAKILPGFSRDKRLQTYQDVLKDALEDGSVNSSSSLKILQHMRQELGITDGEHQVLLLELGVAEPDLLDPDQSQNREQRLRLRGYRQSLEFLLFDMVERGIPLPQMMQEKKSQLRALRQEYNISATEEAQALAEVLHQNSTLVRAGKTLVQQLPVLEQQEQLLQGAASASPGLGLSILSSQVARQIEMVTSQVLGILEIMGDSPEALELAASLERQGGSRVHQLLESNTLNWRQRLAPAVVTRLEPAGAHPLGVSAKPNRTGLVNLLREFLLASEPLIQATALHILADLDPQQGQALVRQLANQGTSLDPVLQETLQQLLEECTESLPEITLEITGIRAEGRQNWSQRFIHIGRGSRNDIVLPDTRVSRKHAVLESSFLGVTVRDAGSVNGLWIGSKRLAPGDSATLHPGDVLSFSPEGQPAICVRWDQRSSQRQQVTTLEKVIWLYTSPFFRGLSHEKLIQLAQVARVQTLNPGDLICRVGDPADALHLLIQGEAQALVDRQGQQEVVGTIHPGQMIGELAVLTHGQRAATVMAVARGTRLLSLDGKQFATLLGSDAQMAQQILQMVSQRLQATLDRLATNQVIRHD